MYTMTYDDLIDKYVSQKCNPILSTILKPLLNQNKIVSEDDINDATYRINNLSEQDKQIGLDIIRFIESVQCVDWMETPSMTFTQTHEFCNKYLTDYPDKIKVKFYADYTPSCVDDSYLSKHTNGGVHSQLESNIYNLNNYIIRTSDLTDLYDPEVNLWHKVMLPTDHVRFALAHLIWRRSNKSDLINDRYMVNEWNRRVKLYYDKLQSVARDKYKGLSEVDNNHFMYCQMLDDIGFDPRLYPYSTNVMTSNLNAYINSKFIRPEMLIKRAGKFLTFDDLSHLGQESDFYKQSLEAFKSNLHSVGTANNLPIQESSCVAGNVSGDITIVSPELAEGNSSELIQPSSIDETACDDEERQLLYSNPEAVISDYLGKIQSNYSLNVYVLYYLCKYIEVTYIYAIPTQNTSKMINTREQMLTYMSRNCLSDFLERFKQTPYYENYCKLDGKLNNIKAVITNVIKTHIEL